MSKPVIVGAVVYDPKVVTIWEIIQGFFEGRGVPMDTVFFTNYELQNDALLAGQLDIAWNSPLAWLDAQILSKNACRAIAMRDTDRDRVSHFVVPIESPYQKLEELRGATVAFGAKDSPQATLIPLNSLRRVGLMPASNYSVIRHDLLIGKHGDHIGGEWEAFQTMQKGHAQASVMLDLNYQGWGAEGRFDASKYRILATTDPFDHCVFTVRPDFDAATEEKWLKTLMEMDYSNPDHKEMMDMEGLKQWLPGRTEGFVQLTEAITAFGYPNR